MFIKKILPLALVFVEPACGGRNTVVTMTDRCACVRPSVLIFPEHNFYNCVNGFQNNLTQMFSITSAI